MYTWVSVPGVCMPCALSMHYKPLNSPVPRGLGVCLSVLVYCFQCGSLARTVKAAHRACSTWWVRVCLQVVNLLREGVLNLQSQSASLRHCTTVLVQSFQAWGGSFAISRDSWVARRERSGQSLTLMLRSIKMLSSAAVASSLSQFCD
jgi:hypothetical protein